MLLNFHLDGVAAPFRGLGRGVAERIVFVKVAHNAVKPAGQVVGIEYGSPACPIGQREQDILIRRDALRELRNNLPRLIQRIE